MKRQLEPGLTVTKPAAGFESTILAVFRETDIDPEEVVWDLTIGSRATSNDDYCGIVGIRPDRLHETGRLDIV